MPVPRIPGKGPSGPFGLPLKDITANIRLPELTGPVLVDVGADPVEANITREGVQVPNLPINQTVLIDILDGIPVRPRLKVVSQSIAAGKAVQRGTLVDLVLSEPDDLPVNIVHGVLQQLEGRKISQVFDEFLADQPQIRKILVQRSQADDLTAADKQAIVGVLGQRGITIDAGDDDAIAGAFLGLQTAQMFGSG